jgi:Protein of unknown function (DUF2934)
MLNTIRNKREVTRERIEKRAYEIYLQRGGMDGTDQEDWLIAEHELLGEKGLSGSASEPEEQERRAAAAGGRSSR